MVSCWSVILVAFASSGDAGQLDHLQRIQFAEALHEALLDEGSLFGGQIPRDGGTFGRLSPTAAGLRIMPFNPMKDRELRKELFLENEAYVFSHTLEDQIGGQLRAGFTLVDILEDVDDDDRLGEYNIPLRF